MQTSPGAEPANYRYDPNFGDQGATYAPLDFKQTADHRPEIGATFVATVEGETIISTIHGHQPVAWRADPGTPCVILGYWSDGTVHIRWPAIRGHYMVDGRFPAWVVAPDPTARMAAGGRILSANDPPRQAAPFPFNLVVLAVVILFAAGVAFVLLNVGR